MAFGIAGDANTNMNFSIRNAGIDDAVLISVLASTTFYEAYSRQDESHNLAEYISESFAVPAVIDEIADPASTFLIAYVDGKAVGYARLIDYSTTDGVDIGRVIELKRIYILEHLWGTGVGELLLTQCITTASERGFDAIWLGVWEENPRARRFYDKFGFKQVGTLTFPYGDVVGINLVLQKNLT